MLKAGLAIALFLAGSTADAVPGAGDEQEVLPSRADPAVKQYDDPDIVIGSDLPASAPLAIFLPGSGGKPANTVGLLRVIAAQGYRVIGLEYDDTPAVVQVCPRDPDPDCSARFREMRVSGTGARAPVANPVAEAIVPRLVATLRYLDRKDPKAGWAGYLDGDQPRWDRITVSGLSQGAGMAAYIAKQHPVRRVVLFSSPWDFTGADRRPAPWLHAASATPPEQWQAEYNRSENTVELIVPAYAALRIPPANIRVFDLDLPPGAGTNSPNPYHAITIRDQRYAPQWRAMFGSGTDPQP